MPINQKTIEEIAAEITANADHNHHLLQFNLDQHVRKQKIYPHITIKMLGLFAQTCTKAEADTAFLRLMTAAVEAEPMSYNPKNDTSQAAFEILKRHPELLFVQGIVVDHVGRKIFASPYQLFLGTGDVWALKLIHEEIISKIADENMRAHMQQQAELQFQQQFPNCKFPYISEMGEEALYDARNLAQIQEIKEHLKNIVNAMRAYRPDSDARNAITKLHQFLAPKQGEIIRSGLHFPLAIMREVFSVYEAELNDWSCERQSLFSFEVIGAVLAASTAVDGQCYKLGLSKLNVEKGPDRRDGLFCRHPIGIPPKLAPISNKLGRTMFVNPYNGDSIFLPFPARYSKLYNKNSGCGVDVEDFGRRASRCYRVLKTYIERKTLGLQNLFDHIEKNRRLGVCC